MAQDEAGDGSGSDQMTSHLLDPERGSFETEMAEESAQMLTSADGNGSGECSIDPLTSLIIPPQ